MTVLVCIIISKRNALFLSYLCTPGKAYIYKIEKGSNRQINYKNTVCLTCAGKSVRL